MKKEIFDFLKSYSCGTNDTNRLIVSSFLKENLINDVNNELISSLLINKSDDDFLQFEEFSSKYKIKSIEELITAFEFVISPEDKVVTGAVYTPIQVREFIVKSLFTTSKTKTATVCDMACGCGGFLYTAALYIRETTQKTYEDIFAKYIYGVDLMDYSVQRTKILLSLSAIMDGEDKSHFRFNIYTGNSLDFNFSEYINSFDGFDAIIGNPPYVCSRNIDDESKKLLSNYTVTTSGQPDLYIPFFEIGLNHLKEDGFLGYITMNTFFKSLNGRALRVYLDSHRYDLSIYDFGGAQVFDSRSTYTCICIINKTPTNRVRYKKNKNSEKIVDSDMKVISYNNLQSYSGWNFQAHKVIERIERTGNPFGDIFKTSTGIATLKNKVFIFDAEGSNDKYYFIDSETKIEKAICQDILNPNKFIKSEDISGIKRKIIYPYCSKKNTITIIAEDKFKKDYPFAYRYLSNHKDTLALRDKGKGKYPEWFAYGRSQGLEKRKFKLLFPHITPVIPKYVLSNDENLLFHNGLGLVSDEKKPLLLAKKIMQSRLFWFYIINTSKPYGSGYFSLSRNYIKNFGIYEFNEEQIQYILDEEDQDKLNTFLEDLYQVDLSEESLANDNCYL